MRYKCIAVIAILVLLSFWQEAENNACRAADGYGTPWQDYNPGFTGQRPQESFNGGFDNTHKPVVRRTQLPQPRPSNPVRRMPEKNTMESLEEALDRADNSASWSKVPITRPAPVRGATPTLINGVNSSYPYTQARQIAAMPGAGTVPANPLAGMFSKMTRQDLMRMFLEGGTPQVGGGFGGGAPSSSADLAGKSSTAYSNYQRAVNEDSKARDYAERARYASSRYSAQEYASSAEYAANNAEYAADRAESAAYSGDSQAKGYASSARDAANRARENANRARYNADQKQ